MNFETAAILTSLALMCGAGADRVSLRPPTDPAPYHARVHRAADALPIVFGDWIGAELTVPQEAKSQLHPNVLISRRYHNTATGTTVSVLLVQCWDIRDLLPHYPPICYPGRGLSLTAARSADWAIPQLSITGTEYEFESVTFQTDKLTIVDNFMILPDGRICRDMNEVEKNMGIRTRFFGAAQVQLVFDSDCTVESRTRSCNELLTAFRPVIDAIRSGVK